MKNKNCVTNSSNAVYGLGMIGSFIYFISTASNFGDGLFGVLKAILWPAFLIFELMQFLGM